ncbi:SIR2 family protein [Flexivirga endophytica]|uniref:SIR2 family protein n=1 Tax=Flexivirga endophytica TaxID=1849103 RepID=UPI00166E5923|nr:SIR2 family protein [Flexivirga endophytica]
MSTASKVPGHVFVIHGKVQDVTCDAALIPTDTRFSVRAQWWQGVIGLDAAPRRPANWKDSGCAQDGTNGRFWYVDVTNDGETLGVAALLPRLGDVIGSVVDKLPKVPVRGRVRHLVTMPLLGSGGGGLGHDEAVQQIRALTELAERFEVDLAIVVPNRAVFEALQRQRANSVTPRSINAEAERLGQLVRQGALSLMIGAGVSMGAGLPGWTELLDQLKDSLVSDAEIVASKEFSGLPPLDQAELLQRIRERGIADGVIAAVTRKAGGKLIRPALGHFLLAGLRCRQVATTNYDLLYEAAVTSQGDAQRIHSLPYERPDPGNPWILKLHGDVKHNDLVLSRSSFVEYDGSRSATGAVFQAMLMTSHVLFVGLSFTDDNVLRLTHEVTSAPVEGDTVLGTTLSLGKSAVRKVLWNGILNWVEIEGPSQCPDRPVDWAKDDEDIADADARWKMGWQVRELEIFLDTVALWSVPNS